MVMQSATFSRGGSALVFESTGEGKKKKRRTFVRLLL